MPLNFAVPSARLIVFVHGCFWHRCRLHYRAPKTRVAHWRAAHAANVSRDARTQRRLRRLGWRTMVVWEHEDSGRAAERVRRRCLKIVTEAS